MYTRGPASVNHLEHIKVSLLEADLHWVLEDVFDFDLAKFVSIYMAHSAHI
jgi:hypothetical protein